MHTSLPAWLPEIASAHPQVRCLVCPSACLLPRLLPRIFTFSKPTQPNPTERAELEALRAQQLVCGSEDVGFLRYLAASYVSRGMHHQALQVLQRLTTLSPGKCRQ